MYARSFALQEAILPSNSCLGGKILDHQAPDGLQLMCVIDFTEVALKWRTMWPLEPLFFPEDGKLAFFYDIENQPWGMEPFDRDGFSLHYSHNMSIDSEGGRCISFAPFVSEPSSDRLADWDDDRYEKYHEDMSKETFKNGWHQLFGYPYPIQGDDFEDDCAAMSKLAHAADSQPEEWVLLLQLDSDDSLNWMFGDSGMLYVFIRKSDLAQGDFSRAWISLQCC